jgi:hypothetical protein
MAPKHHHMPLSGGDRKALTKELSKSRAMTKIFAERSPERRREGETLIREADDLACQSWNERMWSDGSPIDPSPTIDQAINGDFSNSWHSRVSDRPPFKRVHLTNLAGPVFVAKPQAADYNVIGSA